MCHPLVVTLFQLLVCVTFLLVESGLLLVIVGHISLPRFSRIVLLEARHRTLMFLVAALVLVDRLSVFIEGLFVVAKCFFQPLQVAEC